MNQEQERNNLKEEEKKILYFKIYNVFVVYINNMKEKQTKKYIVDS